MTKIYLTTIINADIKTVFDAARNINLHMDSAEKTNEKAIAGTTSGLINLGETVTWRGKHFGIYITHKSKITSLEYPVCFVDEMIKGNFKKFKHQHIFKQMQTGTKMIDILEYKTPYFIFGSVFNHLILKKYLTKFLITRNNFIKTKTELLY